MQTTTTDLLNEYALVDNDDIEELMRIVREIEDSLGARGAAIDWALMDSLDWEDHVRMAMSQIEKEEMAAAAASREDIASASVESAITDLASAGMTRSEAISLIRMACDVADDA